MKMTSSRRAGVSGKPKRIGENAVVTCLTADEVKTQLKEKGITVKAWAQANGYRYSTVSAVLRGINRGTYGAGHRIATKLGLK